MSYRSISSVIAAAALALPVAACDGWLVNDPSPHLAVLLDASSSLENETRDTCEDLRSVLASRLKDGAWTPESRVTVLVMGDPRRPPYMQTLLEPTPIPRRPSALKGGNGHEAARATILDQVDTACRERVTPQKTSPIHSSLYTTIDTLRGLGCNPESGTCHLVLLSDMQETYDAKLRTALRSNKPQSDLPTLDARGILIEACGFSSSRGFLTGTIDATSVERTTRVWSSVLTGGEISLRHDCP